MQEVYNRHLKAKNKRGKQILTHPHLRPTHTKKLNKELGPSTILHLDQDHKLITKENFILWIEKSSFSNATLFLSFQTVQKRHKGATLQTFTRFLPTNCPYHLRRISFTDEGRTQSTPKRLNNKSHKTLALVQ